MRPLLPAADGPPLDPGSDEARRWLEGELAHAEYHQGNTFLDRLAEWFADLFNRSTELPSASNPVSMTVTVVLAVLVVALLAWVLPRVRRERRVRSGREGVLTDPALTAADYRQRADRALALGRFDEALLDAFRALTRVATDRTLLDDAPGRTAHEVGVALSVPFPQHADALTRAADLFDAVRYGDTHVGADEARWVRRLDTELAATRPRHDDGPGGPADHHGGPGGTAAVPGGVR
ncbi:MAG TPA: DUF4129 domain-containing protein [Segeticoccus sp.]|nr:DUF4129 domain-containing protein [Segeticoccus sp.]